MTEEDEAISLKPSDGGFSVTMKPLACVFCGEDTLERVGLSGSYGGFRYINKGENACVECYIDECVKQSMKKHVNKDRADD